MSARYPSFFMTFIKIFLKHQSVKILVKAKIYLTEETPLLRAKTDERA